MSKEHAEYRTDAEIAAEVDKLMANFDEEYAEQSAERDAYFDDPANAEEIAEQQARMDLVIALYNARQEAGLTQKELAARLGISQACITQIERGRRNLTFSTLQRYARACGKKVAVTLM